MPHPNLLAEILKPVNWSNARAFEKWLAQRMPQGFQSAWEAGWSIEEVSKLVCGPLAGGSRNPGCSDESTSFPLCSAERERAQVRRDADMKNKTRYNYWLFHRGQSTSHTYTDQITHTSFPNVTFQISNWHTELPQGLANMADGTQPSTDSQAGGQGVPRVHLRLN